MGHKLLLKVNIRYFYSKTHDFCYFLHLLQYMRTFGEILSTVRKITFADSQTAPVLHMDDSHLDLAEAQT